MRLLHPFQSPSEKSVTWTFWTVLHRTNKTVSRTKTQRHEEILLFILDSGLPHFGQSLTTETSRSRGTNLRVSKTQRNPFLHFRQPLRGFREPLNTTVFDFQTTFGHLRHCYAEPLKQFLAQRHGDTKFFYYSPVTNHQSHSGHFRQQLRGFREPLNTTVFDFQNCRHNGFYRMWGLWGL